MKEKGTEEKGEEEKEEGEGEIHQNSFAYLFFSTKIKSPAESW